LGILADRYLGYRCCARCFGNDFGPRIDGSRNALFYILNWVIGNGLFKPNMTSIISNAYHNHPEKKDGAYSMYYGNAGAFLGIMLCGYIGENFLELGFWISRRFMLFGMLQFFYSGHI
jgi:POT family proton-dependent oligopeptide transporter